MSVHAHSTPCIFSVFHQAVIFLHFKTIILLFIDATALFKALALLQGYYACHYCWLYDTLTLYYRN